LFGIWHVWYSSVYHEHRFPLDRELSVPVSCDMCHSHPQKYL
jgi:hypothetical protein